MKGEFKKLTVEQCKDSGLALVLLSLIGFLIWDSSALVLLALLFLVAAMTYPPVFTPFARFWFGLSALLGTVVSKIILTASFYLLVLPVGLVRKALGKDAMQLRKWKQGSESVFRTRDHLFSDRDLKHPY